MYTHTYVYIYIYIKHERHVQNLAATVLHVPRSLNSGVGWYLDLVRGTLGKELLPGAVLPPALVLARDSSRGSHKLLFRRLRIKSLLLKIANHKSIFNSQSL